MTSDVLFHSGISQVKPLNPHSTGIFSHFVLVFCPLGFTSMSVGRWAAVPDFNWDCSWKLLCLECIPERCHLAALRCSFLFRFSFNFHFKSPEVWISGSQSRGWSVARHGLCASSSSGSVGTSSGAAWHQLLGYFVAFYCFPFISLLLLIHEL